MIIYQNKQIFFFFFFKIKKKKKIEALLQLCFQPVLNHKNEGGSAGRQGSDAMKVRRQLAGEEDRRGCAAPNGDGRRGCASMRRSFKMAIGSREREQQQRRRKSAAAVNEGNPSLGRERL
ncbi:hypothetical protein ACOSQ2_029520 [Xanthoceras sorbifolium]